MASAPDKGTPATPGPCQAPPPAGRPAPPRPRQRPRAAATNTGRTGSARPSAAASNSAVSLRAVRLMPRSRSLTDRGLTPAASASSSWVSLASDRSCRSNPANPSAGCSAMVGIPSAGPHPAARQSGTAPKERHNDNPGPASSPSPATRACRRWAAGRTGAGHREHRGGRQRRRLARGDTPAKVFSLRGATPIIGQFAPKRTSDTLNSPPQRTARIT